MEKKSPVAQKPVVVPQSQHSMLESTPAVSSSEGPPTKKVSSKKASSTENKPLTEADKIWSEIKDRPIEMFALPNQTVSLYCKPVEIEPSKLYLLSTASAVLPSLEMSVKPSFSVERVDRFIVVSRVLVSLIKK